MTARCDVCERAYPDAAVTRVGNYDICERARCEAVATRAELRYYTEGDRGVADVVAQEVDR